MTRPPTIAERVSASIRTWWSNSPTWFPRVVVAAAILASAAGCASYLNTHRRPAELLADARQLVPNEWRETSGEATKGTLLITLNEGIVSAVPRRSLTEHEARQSIATHLASRGCGFELENSLYADSDLVGTCGVTDIRIRLSRNHSTESYELTVHTHNAYPAQLFRSALTTLAAFLLIAGPAAGRTTMQRR